LTQHRSAAAATFPPEGFRKHHTTVSRHHQPQHVRTSLQLASSSQDLMFRVIRCLIVPISVPRPPIVFLWLWCLVSSLSRSCHGGAIHRFYSETPKMCVTCRYCIKNSSITTVVQTVHSIISHISVFNICYTRQSQLITMPSAPPIRSIFRTAAHAFARKPKPHSWSAGDYGKKLVSTSTVYVLPRLLWWILADGRRFFPFYAVMFGWPIAASAFYNGRM
jgi:hypothetical protein